MDRKQQALSALESVGTVAVLRTENPAYLHEIADAVREGGVRHLEITMTVPGALDLVADLRVYAPELYVGVGTVLDVVTARMALLAGADYVVSPCFDRPTVDLCKQYGVAVMPGALTPTEVATAWAAGADIVKLFPGRVATPDYVADLLGPLPHIKLLPTTEMTPETAAAYVRAGATAIGVGWRILDPVAIAERRFRAIQGNARRYVQAVGEALASRRREQADGDA